MKKLELTFEKFGSKFETIKRNGNLGLFCQSVGENGNYSRYVVAKIIDKPDNIIYGSIVLGGESLPSLESWGKKAWTFLSLGEAETKLEIEIQKANS